MFDFLSARKCKPRTSGKFVPLLPIQNLSNNSKPVKQIMYNPRDQKDQ